LANISTSRLYSLRQIYLSFATITGIIVVALVLLAHSYVTDAGFSSSSNIKQRDEILQHSHEIKRTLWEANSALDAYLLSPIDSYRDTALQQLVDAQRHTNMLAKVTPLHNINPEQLGIVLRQQLVKLEQITHELIAIRINAEQQYPSIQIVRSTMLPNHTLFTTNISLILDELESDDETPKEAIQETHKLRSNWARMISSFRLYLANILSSFNKPELIDQERDISMTYSLILNNLAQLDQMNQRGVINLLNTDALDGLSHATYGWYDGLMKIKLLHASDEWRSDIQMVEKRFRPLFNTIIIQLQNLDRSIGLSAARDVDALSSVAGTISNALRLMALIGLAFISIVYFFFNRSVLKPIAIVAQALTNESRNKAHIEVPKLCTLEAQNLVDAFGEMRRQVNIRQNELEHQALHDTLTGLPNRALINDRIEQAVRSNHRSNTPFALIMMDLDRFKEINDTLGHHAGDDILCQISKRLRAAMRDSDTIARLGGDEFAILLPSANKVQAIHISEKITETMERVFQLNEHKLYIGASLGIALFPEHGKDSTTLLQRADVAMYLAKRTNSDYAFYNPEYDEYSVQSLALVSDLRNAIDNSELLLYYQPKLDLVSGTITGVEALLRWDHTERGFIAPDEMVAIAEKTGLIKSLTLWVLQEALCQCARWHSDGINLRVAVNLSVWNLQDAELPEQVAHFIEKCELETDSLTLEITEGAMMADPESAIRNLSRLDAMNIRLSVDDFGTGFSSLTYLKRLPVDELKIDKSFVMDMINDENDAAIVRSTIDLAHNLDLKVVAEGVENLETLQQLSQLGCDVAQGYHIGKPMSADAFNKWISESSWLTECRQAKA